MITKFLEIIPYPEKTIKTIFCIVRDRKEENANCIEKNS